MKRLLHAAGLLAAIMTSSSDAIASQTLDGIVTSWNPAAERLFGYSEQEMIGQSITRLVLPGREKEERHILAQIAAGIQVAYETLRIRKDGMVLAVSVSVTPIVNKTGRVMGAVDDAVELGQQGNLLVGQVQVHRWRRWFRNPLHSKARVCPGIHTRYASA